MRCDFLVVGCGLTGAVIARQLAEQGRRVVIWERRNHIGGNLYDYVDNHGFLVQKYGPHIFFTEKQNLFDYVCRFEQWDEYRLVQGAEWDGKYTPVPFNFTTIDTFYPPDQSENLKAKILEAYKGQETATVVELLQHPDSDIRGYAEYLFQNDYALYTAKQWGLPSSEIDPSILKRVPVRFSYREECYDVPYQALPSHSYTTFFEHLLDLPNIDVQLGVNALEHLSIHENHLYIDKEICNIQVVYTGALDELFSCTYGKLPYRSLRFDWHFSDVESLQKAAIMAYPKAKEYTRITEYKKIPIQKGYGTSYAVEYPIPYQQENHCEPYYPILTYESQCLYAKYKNRAKQIPNLNFCGRLADFKYYNMDQALERALEVSIQLKKIKRM